MCLILFAYKYHPDYKLIVAANRDEFYERETAPASYWDDLPEVLAGRDLEAGGTWMGVSTRGRVSMLTNYRDLANINPQAPTRGKLVSNFLATPVAANDYLDAIDPMAATYNDFNLLVGTVDDLWYYSNRQRRKTMLGSGIYGLSNHLLNTPWPKVRKGQAEMKQALKNFSGPEDLFEILASDVTAPDHDLPDTGVGTEMERMLSPLFIKSHEYGTRCSTVLTIDQNNIVRFIERTFNTQTFDYKDRAFEFKTI